MNNREYRSDVFSMLMEDPKNAMSVYNTLNHSDYQDLSLIQIYKLENGMHLTIRNDASFLIDAYLSLYEHQSTYSPNLPLRFLIYVVHLFENIVQDRNLFGRARIKVPTPNFVVFYNGEEKRPEIEYMKLSDAFEQPTDEPELELICTVYNINPDHNTEIIEQNDVLREYTQFVECVKKHMMKEAKGGPVTKEVMERALDLAIAECMENHILEDFLKTRGDEVRRNIMLDYTFERRLELNQAENQEIIDRQAAEIKQQADELNQKTDKIKQQAAEINQQAAELKQQAAEINQQAAELKQQKDRIRQLEKLLADKGTDV